MASDQPPADVDIDALVGELRAIAKALGLLAEPLLDAEPRNGQARRRERDDLITELRRAEGRVLDVIRPIWLALRAARTALWDTQATLGVYAAKLAAVEEEIAVAREACPSVRRQDNFDAPLLTLVANEVTRGFMLDSAIIELRAKLAAAEQLSEALQTARAIVEHQRNELLDTNAALGEARDAAERGRAAAEQRAAQAEALLAEYLTLDFYANTSREQCLDFRRRVRAATEPRP